jgi:hypothetical protein
LLTGALDRAGPCPTGFVDLRESFAGDLLEPREPFRSGVVGPLRTLGEVGRGGDDGMALLVEFPSTELEQHLELLHATAKGLDLLRFRDADLGRGSFQLLARGHHGVVEGL